MVLPQHYFVEKGQLATSLLKMFMKWKKKIILPANIINMGTRELYFYNLEAIITVYTFKLAYYLHFTDEETYIHR